MQHVQIVTRCELALGCILFTHTAASLSPFTRVLKTFTRTLTTFEKTHKRGTQFHSFIKAKMNSVASYSMSDFMWPEGTHMDFLVGGAQIISKEIILGHKKSIPCLLFPA
jgi:hypothetical protein